MTEDKFQAAWNYAEKYYEIIQAVEEQITTAYAENDVRETWKWVSYLLDRIWLSLNKKERDELGEEEEQIEEDIYESAEGDKLGALFEADTTDLVSFRRQMRSIRKFHRKLMDLMQRKSMILPKQYIRNPSEAILSSN